MLGFIYTLDHPEMVGLNPEAAHELMAGLNFVHGVAQALEAGKLFHIDLNDQKGPRYDQDFRFGSENLKSMFFLVKLLEENGYTGPRHFDAHAHRTEDEQGVWDFALGCMRTYNIFKAKAKRFTADPEIQALLRTLPAAEYEPRLAGVLRRFADGDQVPCCCLISLKSVTACSTNERAEITLPSLSASSPQRQ